MPETVEQFAARIKAKYPEYQSVPDAELTERIITKYPEYRSAVQLEQPEQPGMLRQVGEAAIETLPVAGAMVGGIAGLPFGGPAGSVGGAGIGAMGGEALRQLIRGGEETPEEAAQKIILQGAVTGAGGEVTGMGLAKLLSSLSPALRRGAERTFQKFLGPTKEKMKGTAEKVTSEALRRGRQMIGTREGVQARAELKADAEGEAVEREITRIAEEAAPRIVERTGPVPKALTSGPIRLPAPGGAEKPLSVEAEHIASRIVYFKNPQSGQLEFFAKPALGKGEFQRVLWGPEFTGTEREIAEIRKVYGSKPANPKEIEEILFAQRGKPGPQIIPGQAKEEADYARRVATGEIRPSPDVRPLKGLSDFFQVEEKTISTKPFLAALKDYKKQFMPGGKVAIPEAVRQVEAVERVVRQYGDAVSPTTLIALRRSLDRPVARKGGYAGLPLAEESLVSVRKELADSIRRVLGEEYPSLARVNAEFSFWESIAGILQETNRRTTGQTGPLGKIIYTAAGFGGGVAQPGSIEERLGRGALYGSSGLMFAAAVRSGVFRSAGAAFKNRLAEAMARGDGAQTGTLLLRLLSGKAIGSSEKPAE